MKCNIILLLFVFLSISCYSSSEELYKILLRIEAMELNGTRDCSIDCYKGYFYQITNKNGVYLARIPIASDSLISLSRKATAQEIELYGDNVSLLQEKTALATDNSFASEILYVCLKYREINSILPKRYYLSSMRFNQRGEKFLVIIDNNELCYNVLMSKSGLGSLSDFIFGDSNNICQYYKISDEVYCRVSKRE